MRIGIDFDNTIVSYGALFSHTAAALGYLAGPAPGKTSVRDAVRNLADGEQKWRTLQAAVYGPAIGSAPPFPGVREFLTSARGAGATLFLVSHKSRYAANDPHGTDLREAALGWLAANAFVGAGGFARENVYFEDTRAAKVERLAALACTHVIDDLVEVFEEPGFPPAERLLFAPEGANAAGDWTCFTTWDALRARLFPNG